MPELPEVEITTRNLNQILQPPTKILTFQFFRQNLRSPIAVDEICELAQKDLLSVYRRAKFIIFKFTDCFIVNHLGMTGSWRLETASWQQRKHDHIALGLGSKKFLIYNDPRRFGEFLLQSKEQVQERFRNYGPEPLDTATVWDEVTTQFRQLTSPIKVSLMNQKYLVGVGNIYASEALFRAGIRPSRRASRVTVAEYKVLWEQVKIVLQESINAGGSSIQDFRNGYGEQGNFQKRFSVYDRANQMCFICDEKIKVKFFAGRSTFWCGQCQK